ncbi:protein translocase SEC61 complex gamma subunit [Thecamonas trahens ATCC 50062]|uniref:Protein translocase SEC61 complex gamma subunit n=1 Tax=Thecamonas trahens ATCC 50062 TaxID=461836 RepID=A0A0L0DRY9_THETB|nr:protein translocase SEC61 complex gamma subunit [Thecamonas trahens ATCC 50062]KNC55069.1 protein translocase SEC61 complex gamma subunit [Thecamonas trahens ATCC 50062]|eukprot:XP_013753372.1 protein translocase SEC61 complex gamma subunit [Thecamonas trahens ATCC 50062]
MDAVVDFATEYYADAKRLVNKCEKPDTRELKKVFVATGIGFAALGAIGFVCKLVFIPINNIIVGS